MNWTPLDGTPSLKRRRDAEGLESSDADMFWLWLCDEDLVFHRLLASGYLNRVPRDSTGTPMVVRKAKRTGKKFWGSSLFPKNNETRRLDAESCS